MADGIYKKAVDKIDKIKDSFESWVDEVAIDDTFQSGRLTGLDPVQIEYARKLGEIRSQQIDNQMLAMQKMWLVDNNMLGGISPMQGAAAGGIISSSGMGNVVRWTNMEEPTQEKKELDKRRHAKIFIHFAQEFVKRFPKWEIVLDETDPFHNMARLIRKSDGVVIHNLYPDNQVAVLGGPNAWTEPRKEMGQSLPLAKVCTQDFYGWAIGLEDVPEWIVQ